MSDPRAGQTTIQSNRPWGDIYMVIRNQKCSVDLTEVKPGERASLHSHSIRHELFHFLDDGGVLEIDGDLFYPKAQFYCQKKKTLPLSGCEHIAAGV